MFNRNSTLNSLRQGELAAVETYEQALTKLGDTKGAAQLRHIQTEHRDAAELLRRHIYEHGGEPEKSSGLWGVFAQAVEGTAKMFGANAALKALKEGELHGIKQYEAAVNDVDCPQDCRTLIVTQLLQKAHTHVPVLDRLMAGFVERISVEEARRHVAAGAFLVCAYVSPEKYRLQCLVGSIPLHELEARLDTLPKHQELIFHCTCPSEGTSARVAEHYHQLGFTNVKALFGGADAWRLAGYGVIRPSNFLTQSPSAFGSTPAPI